MTCATMTETRFLSTGQAALRLGCLPWHLDTLIKRHLVPAPERVGRCRLIPVDQLPALTEALRAAGYLAALEPAAPTTQPAAAEKCLAGI